ncbi:hypothetical protein WJ438_00470 [Streptomyces sp. GD-15H]|uniref:hypothetical protein n=1 Tax=Streptomyces sp. GD-15H TaxID=3129112 RepID=UPI0032461E45
MSTALETESTPLRLSLGNDSTDVLPSGCEGPCYRLVTEAGGTWSRYASSDHERRR